MQRFDNPMAHNQPRYDQQSHHNRQQLTHKVAKTTTAVTIGSTLMVLSGLTLTATVIGLTVATPLLVIFSPVLVPAAVTLFLIFAGLLTSTGFGATASFVFYWMYRYATGKHPPGAHQLDRIRDKFAQTAAEIRDKAEHFEQEHDVSID
ncbi:hypothetical protein LIER_35079 [Lithospermum erythrorhizon]|uniref:Oleosin n=1 Tax=Lithospermum erythrorhizon TaxID=34254 RepID=A0AAV3NKC5_LITER